MNNPLRILQTLDRHLTQLAELTLFGRAALVLGYPNAPASFAATHDVDAILPLQWLAKEHEMADFWQAQQRTNRELEPSGLYITHLFRETDVILTPDWHAHRVFIPLELRHLKIYRPATVDLVLSKMARCDDHDLADIQFLLQQEPLTAAQLQKAFQQARVPDVPEIHELFRAAQPKVLALTGAA